MKIFAYSISTIALVASASPAIAADASPEGAGEIIVTATRTAQPIERVGSSATVISSKEIERKQLVGAIDLLRTVPGVTVAGNGSYGAISSAFIRGADSSQTLMLIDGMKVNDVSSTNAAFDFGGLLNSNFERVEIVRGAQSVLWGSQAIGGVINFISPTPTEDFHANGFAEGGALNTFRAGAQVTGKYGPVGANIGADFHRTDGISVFNRDRGGFERDSFSRKAGHANFNIALTDGVSIDLRARASHARAGNDTQPPPLFRLTDSADIVKTNDVLGYAGINVALFDGRFTNRVSISRTISKRANLSQAIYPYKTSDSDGVITTYEYQGGLDIMRGLHADFGVVRERSRMRTAFFSYDPSFGGSYFNSFGRASAAQTSIYGQLVAKPFKGLTLIGGARRERQGGHGLWGSLSTFGDTTGRQGSRVGKTVKSVSGSYTPNDGRTVIRASYGEGFRAPSLYNLYSEFGNMALKPESSKGWDAGVTQKLLGDQIEFSVTRFKRRTRNLIDFVSCPFGSTAPMCVAHPNGYYDNIERAKVKGIEATLVLRPTKHLTVSANFTHLAALKALTLKDVAAGYRSERNLVRRPRNHGHVDVDWQTPLGVRLGAGLTAVSASFETIANTPQSRMSGYTLIDLRASYPVTEQIEVYGRIENLTNRHYETALGYGNRPRGAFVGARLKL